MYYSNKCPNVFKNTKAVDFLLDRFNNYFSGTYGKFSKTVFESYENIQEGVKQSIVYQNSINLLKDLPIPPVDTDLVYASYKPTVAALVLDDNDYTNDSTYLRKGGDSTVPTWSSLLTGFKWIYDKKKQSLPQNIRLIEYCSRLSDSGQYKYDANKSQNFAAIGCSCLNSDNEYLSSTGSCTHASLISDEPLMRYVVSVADDPKETAEVTASKKSAVSRYSTNIDYENNCNNRLYQILDTAE
jgi:hypothetical protein